MRVRVVDIAACNRTGQTFLLSRRLRSTFISKPILESISNQTYSCSNLKWDCQVQQHLRVAAFRQFFERRRVGDRNVWRRVDASRRVTKEMRPCHDVAALGRSSRAPVDSTRCIAIEPSYFSQVFSPAERTQLEAQIECRQRKYKYGVRRILPETAEPALETVARPLTNRDPCIWPVGILRVRRKIL